MSEARGEAGWRFIGLTHWLVWGCRRGCDRMAGVAHRDRLLEDDVDAAARCVFERLFGLVAEDIVGDTVK